MMVDRYEVGERQTSACAAPTEWLVNMGVEDSMRQTFGELVIHSPHATVRYDLPWTFSTFDYRTLCGLLADQGSFQFETAKVDGRTGDVVHTDRGQEMIKEYLQTKSVWISTATEVPNPFIQR